MNIEIFGCAGGMALGFKRAGIEFDLVVDKDPNAVASYEHNLGHRPVQMDAHDLARLVELGFRPDVRLLVADPPCTPWSTSGSRKGLDDERDCMLVTVELIKRLRPLVFLIGNVPGLDTLPNVRAVQQTIGSLHPDYCIDYVSLDAADYGVPQHRRRPFWFGHSTGACITWPARTHGAPSSTPPLFEGEQLLPHVTCRDALGHLPLEEIGRPVRLRRRPSGDPHASDVDKPARGVRTKDTGDGTVLYNAKHPPNEPSEPSRTITGRLDHSVLAEPLAGELTHHPRHPPSEANAPARVITAGDGGGCKGTVLQLDSEVKYDPKHKPSKPDEPGYTVAAKDRNQGGGMLEWPWTRPATTVRAKPDLSKPGHHDPALAGDQYANWMDERPSTTIMAEHPATGGPGKGSIGKRPGAVVLSEKAAALLQSFPEDWQFCGRTKKERWSQIGQAMPPGLAEPVARSVAAWFEAHT